MSDRYLFLPPSDWSDGQISSYMETLPSLYGEGNVYVNMKDWYKDHFMRTGTRTTWVFETIHGKQSDTREPHFAGFIVSPLIDGPAYAIARHALAYGKIVLLDKRQVKDLEPNENNSYSVIS